jgi:hypothetical protein
LYLQLSHLLAPVVLKLTYVYAAVPSSPDVLDHITLQLMLTNQTYLPIEGRTFIFFHFFVIFKSVLVDLIRGNCSHRKHAPSILNEGSGASNNISSFLD